MSYALKTKDNSIHREQVTPDLRHKRRSTSVTVINETITQIPVEPTPQDFFTRYIVRTNKAIYKWLQTRLHLLKREYRAYQAFLQIDNTIEIPTNTWVVLPYKNIKIMTEKYDTSAFRYYSVKRGAYYVNASLYYRLLSAPTIGAELAVFKNDIYYATIAMMVHQSPTLGSLSNAVFINGGCLVPLLCGDYIDIRFAHQTGVTNRLEPTDNHYGHLSVNYEGANYRETNLGLPIRS